MAASLSRDANGLEQETRRKIESRDIGQVCEAIEELSTSLRARRSVHETYAPDTANHRGLRPYRAVDRGSRPFEATSMAIYGVARALSGEAGGDIEVALRKSMHEVLAAMRSELLPGANTPGAAGDLRALSDAFFSAGKLSTRLSVSGAMIELSTSLSSAASAVEYGSSSAGSARWLERRRGRKEAESMAQAAVGNLEIGISHVGGIPIGGKLRK